MLTVLFLWGLRHSVGQANNLNKILNFFAMWLHAILSITKGSAKSNVVDGRRNSGRDIQWDQSQSEITLAFISVLSIWKNLMKTKVYPPFNFFPAKDLFGEFYLKFGTD